MIEIRLFPGGHILVSRSDSSGCQTHIYEGRISDHLNIIVEGNPDSDVEAELFLLKGQGHLDILPTLLVSPNVQEVKRNIQEARNDRN